MDLVIKTAAAALTAAAAALVVKKSNPELALLLSAVTVCVILISASGVLKNIVELSDTVKSVYKGREIFIAPVFKCLAISIVTKISCELCRESTQNAMAAALELTGTLCALSSAMPMLKTMLKMIGGML